MLRFRYMKSLVESKSLRILAAVIGGVSITVLFFYLYLFLVHFYVMSIAGVGIETAPENFKLVFSIITFSLMIISLLFLFFLPMIALGSVGILGILLTRKSASRKLIITIYIIDVV